MLSLGKLGQICKKTRKILVKSRDLRPYSVFLFIGEQNIPNGCRVRDLKTAEVL